MTEKMQPNLFYQYLPTQIFLNNCLKIYRFFYKFYSIIMSITFHIQKQNINKIQTPLVLSVLIMKKSIVRLCANIKQDHYFALFLLQAVSFFIGCYLTIQEAFAYFKNNSTFQSASQIQINFLKSDVLPSLLLNLVFSLMVYFLMEKNNLKIKQAAHLLIVTNLCLLFMKSQFHLLSLLVLTGLSLFYQQKKEQKVELDLLQQQSEQNKNIQKISTLQVTEKTQNQKIKLVNFKTASGNTVKSQPEQKVVKQRRKIKMVSIMQNMENNKSQISDQKQNDNLAQIFPNTQNKIIPSSRRRSQLVIKQIQRITNPRQYNKRRKTEVILSKIKPSGKQQFDPYAWSQMHDLNSCGSSFSGTSSLIQAKHQKPYLMKSQNLKKKQLDTMSRMESQRLKSLVEIRSIVQDTFVCQKLDTTLISKQYFDYEMKPYVYITEKLRDVFMKQIPQQQVVFTFKLEAFQDFLRQLGSLYNTVPYHNITHAFDVMTTMDKYLNDYGNILNKIKLVRQDKIGRSNELDIQMLRIICLITAYAHDCGHEGFTSAFYLNTHDDLAINYLYESPLEQMHTSNLLALLRKYPVVMETLCLPYRSNKDFNQISFQKQIKHLMIKMILATDNAKHFQMIQRFRGCKQKIRYFFDEPQVKRFNTEKLNKQEQTMVLQMLLHSADLSNCAKDLEFLGLWTNHLYEEFKYQAAVQKEMGLPYSFGHIDFDNANLSQIGFINGFICPMISQICFIQPKFTMILQKALRNAQHYRKKQEQRTKRWTKSDNELLQKMQSDKEVKVKQIDCEDINKKE